MTETISTLVDGGKANAGPPLGPALGPLPVNIGDVVSKINEKTKEFEGMQVPVDVEVDEETGDFTITVGTPPTAALLLEQAEIEKGSGEPNAVKVANLPLKRVIKVAKMKRNDLVAMDLAGATNEVLGTAQSMGLLVDGKEPREVQQEVNDGKYDAVFAGDEELADEAKGGDIDTEAAQQRLEERAAEREAEAEEEEEEAEAADGEDDEETAADEETVDADEAEEGEPDA